jgi:hypothetical protein
MTLVFTLLSKKIWCVGDCAVRTYPEKEEYCKLTWSIISIFVRAQPFFLYASWTSSHELQQSSSDCTWESQWKIRKQQSNYRKNWSLQIGNIGSLIQISPRAVLQGKKERQPKILNEWLTQHFNFSILCRCPLCTRFNVSTLN